MDYALFLHGAPRLFVEAKGLGENLDDRKWANQIISYATVAGVGWAVLTDGDEYRLYNAHVPVPVEEKLFRRVKISEEGDHPERTLSALSKAHLASMEDVWHAEYANRQVQSVAQALFAGPDAGLIRLVRKRISGLPTAEIRSILTRVRVEVETREPIIIDESAPPARVKARTARPAKPRARARSEVSLRDVIAAGLISTPVEVSRVYRGKTLTARIEPDGTVRFAGAPYKSLSAAAGAARASIIGRSANGQNPATNGWSFWCLADAAGRPTPMSTLRSQVPEGAATSNVRPLRLAKA